MNKQLKNYLTSFKQKWNYRDIPRHDVRSKNGEIELQLQIETQAQKTIVKKLTKEQYVRQFQILSDKTASVILQLPESDSFDHNTEHDKTEAAWDSYRKRYGENLKDNLLYGIEVNGEVDFNFGFDRLIEFRKIVNADKTAPEDEKQKTLTALNFCASQNYTSVNFSLMPVTGALQKAKQSIGHDRFDTFIWALDLYYKGQELLLNSACTVENQSALKKSLAKFKDVDDYCNRMYAISNTLLVKDLIKSGAKAIDSTARVNEYINLALSVWRIRSEQRNGRN